jgi:SAM-dependent methyltransferase
MSLSPQDWHRRFSQQARWTQDLRKHLFSRAGLDLRARILDVGCGTGILQLELRSEGFPHIHGLDIDPRLLSQAKRNSPSDLYVLGDAHSIPYADHSFDLTLCHFLLLWVENPNRVLGEMRRVTRQGGVLMILAEPDYGGRIDYPPELVSLGRLQAESLRAQGAEPEMGRLLGSLLSSLGLEKVETGVLGAQWSGNPPLDEIESEWAVIRSDLGNRLSQEQLHKFKEIEARAWERGARVLFVPTFFGWGIVPG